MEWITFLDWYFVRGIIIHEVLQIEDITVRKMSFSIRTDRNAEPH